MTCVMDKVLHDIINKITINVYDGERHINLVDLFPLAKQGICTLGSLASLIYTYQLSTNLDDVNETIELWSKVPDNLEYEINNRVKKIRNEIDKDLYDESCLIDDMYHSRVTLFSKGDFYSIIQKLLERGKRNIVVALNNHPKTNKLYFCIASGSFIDMDKLLLTYDARGNNYKAYHLAIDRGSNNILSMVKESIVLRILLHREILRKFLIYDNLVSTIYYLMVL